MKDGGGKNKGSEWERATGRALSLWLTNEERKDIFSRNVLSGGTFTLAESKGAKSSHMPGDLMAAHPLAFKFLERFSVECKHLASIGLEAYFWDTRGGKDLGEIIRLAKRQAASIGLEYMLIARQNRRDPLIFVNGDIGKQILGASRGTRAAIFPMYHLLHRGSTFVMRFDDMIRFTDPMRLLTKE